MLLKKLMFLLLLSFTVIAAVFVGSRYAVFTGSENAAFDWSAGYFRGGSKGDDKVAIILIDDPPLKLWGPWQVAGPGPQICV